MTEDEAKTKWCPHARDSETAGNRSFNLPEDIRFPCLGSACMAWRWEFLGTNSRGDRLYSDRVGYCGLAGSPQ